MYLPIADKESLTIPYRSYQRYLVGFIVTVLVILVFEYEKNQGKVDSILLRESLNDESLIGDWSLNNQCVPGDYRTTNKLQYRKLTLPLSNYQQVDLPVYMSHDVNSINHIHIKSAVIVQHGNLRNANDYFCGMINSILYSDDTVLQHTIIIAPQFFADGDICWNDLQDVNSFSTVNTLDKNTWCGLQVWTFDGWKDGKRSMDLSTGIPFFSYDVYNLIIERLLDRTYFPNLERITMFGFSAGAQVLLRYAAYPHFKVPADRNIRPGSDVTSIRYIISDPSTFLYFDARRPLTTDTRVQNQHMQSVSTDIQASPLNLNAIYNNNGLKFSPKIPFNYYSASHPVGKIALPYANGHQFARKNEVTHQPSNIEVTYQPTNSEVTYLPSSKNNVTQQPSSKNEATSQPTTISEVTHVPTSKFEVTQQPVKNEETLQPTIKTELVYSAVDVIYRRLLDVAPRTVTTEHSGSAAASLNNRDIPSSSDFIRKAQSALPDQILTQSDPPEILFGYPEKSWNIWQVDDNNTEWIADWDSSSCNKYNDWRYGMDSPEGYFRYHYSLNPENFVRDVINKFQTRNIIYLAGTGDAMNCRLHSFPGCFDNELATYCQAMLQGNNRLDRMIKWKAYLYMLYGKDVHALYFAPDVVHDPVDMMSSSVGKCLIVGVC